MKKVFVTGASGFVGSYFLEQDPLKCRSLEIDDISNIDNVLKAIKVVGKDDFVVHLAAQSHVGLSFDEPEKTYEVNVNGTYNLLKSLRKVGFQGRVLIVSSGDIYGSQSLKEMPIDEHSELRPNSPYAASKIMAEYLAYAEAKRSSYDVLFARSFNHIGPRQSSSFVIASFAKQLCELMKVEQPTNKITVGNITPQRDFTDVRDVVCAYMTILEKGESFKRYNVASGRSISIEGVLKKLIQMTVSDVEFIVDQKLFRKNDQMIVEVNNSKLRSLGWEPVYCIDQSLKDIIDYWKGKI